MKSVHLTNYYHPRSGGISTSLNNLLVAAERHRRLVRLIVPGKAAAVVDVNPWARIYYVPARRSPIIDARYRLMLPWHYMAAGSPIRRILLDERPDLIEVTDKYLLSMLAAMIRIGKFKALPRPLLVHFSAERLDDQIASFVSRTRAGAWFARQVVRHYLWPIFDCHIANSNYTAQEFRDASEGAGTGERPGWFLTRSRRWFKAPKIPDDERLYVCPRGANADVFRADRKTAAARARLCAAAGVPAKAVVLLYAGRLSREKNIGLLVEMMKVLARDARRDFRLVVAGEGPRGEWLRVQTGRRCPGKIVQLGHLDKETLADYCANADVFVHPNPREPFGIAPLEAMLSGVPTLAPPSGGILTYATEDNAWLVEPTGARFAAAVNEILDHPSLSRTRTDNAVRTALNHTRDKSTDRLLATYDRMWMDFERRRDLFVGA